MKKEEVYVVIDSEEKRLRAIQILSDAGEKIWEDSCLFEIYSEPFILAMSKNKEWCVMIRIDDEINISLDQLEQILSPIKEVGMSLDALKLIAESWGFKLVKEEREIKVGDFGKFWDDGSCVVYGFLESISDVEPKLIYKRKAGALYINFAHLTDEEKQQITENW
jgi:hypothetical protein